MKLLKDSRQLLGMALLLFSGLAAATTTINQQFTPATIDPGDTSAYRITIANASTVSLTAAAVTAVLPSEITITNTPSITNTCGFTVEAATTAGASTVYLTGGTIPAGNGTVDGQCFFQINVSSITSGNHFVNIPANPAFTITPDSTTPGYLAYENGTKVANTTAANATLSVNSLQNPTGSKSFLPSPAIAGDPTTLTITLTNPNAGATIPLTTFTDTLPAGMVVAATPAASTSCSGTGSVNGSVTAPAGASSIILTGGTIGRSGTCTISAKVVVASVGSVDNTLAAGAIGNIRGLTSPAFNKTLTVNTPITVSKSFNPTTIPSGQPSLMKITITNNSTANALDITNFADNLTGTTLKILDTASSPVVAVANPAVVCDGTGAANGTLTAAADTADTTLTLANAKAGSNGKCVITAYVTSTTDGAHLNTIAANAVTNPNNYPSPTASATLNTNAQLTIDKTRSIGNVAPGQWVEFTVTIRNWSGAPVTGVSFLDLLPKGSTDPTKQMVLYNPNVTGYTDIYTTDAGCSGGTWTGTDAAGTTTGNAPVSGTDPGLRWTGGTIVAGSGANPGICTIKIRAQLPAGSATGLVFSNQIPINGASNGTIGNPEASPAANVTTASAIAVTKGFNPASIAQGGQSTLTIRIRNRFVKALTDVDLTDNLPAGITLAANPAATNTCGGTLQAFPNDNKLILSNGTVNARPNANEYTECEITAKVTGTAVGSYINTIRPADVTTNGGTTIPADVSATLAIGTGLSGSKTFTPSSVTSGGTARVKITVLNGTNGQLTNVSANDSTFSTGLTVANPANASTNCGGSPTVVANPGAINAQLLGATLPAGGSCDFFFDVVTSGAGPWSNTIPAGSITSAEGPVSTAAVTANLTVQTAQININKSFNPVLVTGGVPSVLQIDVINPSGIVMHGVGFTDVFPTGIEVYSVPNASTTCTGGMVTAIPGDGKITLTGATVAANQTCKVLVTTTSVRFLNLTNTIPAQSVITDEGYTNPQGTSASLSTLQGLGIMKGFAPDYIGPNDTATLKMRLVSTFDPNAPTPLTLTGVSYTDTLPSELVVAPTPNASTDCAGTGPGGKAVVTANAGTNLVTLSQATIPPGTNCVIQADVKAPATLGAYNNTIPANAVTSNQGIPNQSAANATLNVVNSPKVTKAFANPSRNPGQANKLTVTIQNNDPSSALTGVSLTDTLPAGLAIASTSNAGTTCTGGAVTAIPGGNSLRLTSASIAANASCTFFADVVGNAPGTYTNNINDRTLSSSQGLTNSALATAEMTVGNPPTVSKAFDPVSIAANGTSKLTINLGNSNASPITLSSALVDALPGNVVVASTPNIGGNCTTGSVTATAGGSSITYASGATILAGGCTISVDVTSSTTAVYTNTIAAGQLQTSVGNNQNPATANLAVGGGLVPPTVSKAFSPGTVAINGTSTLTITLGNPNASALTLNAIFTDTLPGNVKVAATPAIGGTCTGTVTATAGADTITYANGATIPIGGCTITVAVTSAVGGSYTNTIAAGALKIDGGNNLQPATAGLVVQAQVPPTVTKLFNPGTINPGGISTLTINLGNSNGGAITLSSILTDTLPTGVTVAGTPNIGGSCTTASVTATANATSIAYASGATIPNGGCTIQVDVTASDSTASPYTNTIAAGALQTSAGNNGAAATSRLFVNPPQPSSISKSFSPSSILKDGISTLTLSFGNGNAAGATLNADFVDTLPANVKVAATPNIRVSTGCTLDKVVATANAGTVTYQNGGIIPAGGCSVSVDVTSGVANPGYLNSIAAGDLKTTIGNNAVGASATLVVVQPASLAGFVYVDSDSDGQKDAGETAGIPGVTVKLTGTDDLGAAVNLTRTTAANGSYSFTNLRPGTAYTVTETKPTAPATGVQVGTGGTASGTAGSTATTQFVSGIGIAAGNTLINYNFGHLPLPPLAANDTATTNLNTPVTLRAFANDIAGVGGTLNLGSITAATSFTVAGEGTFVANANGTVTFTPVNGFVGVVTVPYTIKDQSTPAQTSNIANLTVTVRDAPNNANPAANPDFATTQINTAVTLPVASNASNDAPGTGNTLNPATVDLDPATSGRQTSTTTAEGSWTANNDGTVTFTPVSAFTGTATLNYTVQDSGGGTSNQATITVVVTGGPTVARNDSGTTTPITPITLSVLNNDEAATGCSFDPATLDIDTATAGRQNTVITGQGTWNASDSGTVTFTPASGFSGTTTPQPYAVTDSCNTTVTAAITIIVNPTANPTAVNDAATTGFNTAVTLNPAGNDSAAAGAVLNPSTVDLDPNAAGIQRGPVTTAQGVWEVIDNAGTVRFTPTNDYIGTTPAFTYAISDSLGNTATATMTVTVTTAPDMTVALIGFPQVVSPGAAVSGNVICTNSGGSAASGAVCAVSGLPAGATVTCSPVPPTNRLAGETINCAVNFTAPASGLISLTATTGASNDTNPDNNTATGNIAIVDAVNDGLSTFPSSSGGIINVLGNDLVGNTAATVSTTIGLPTLPNNGGLTGAAFNAAGQLVIPANAVPGTYNLTYQICALNVANACDTATVQVTITATVGTITGIVFNDANGNSVQDSGEPGISGVTVTLKDAQGATVKTATTDSSGQYSFSNVTAGSYSVVETDPAGYTSTTPNTVAVTVPANGSATAKFGDRQPSGTISGVVFNDVNNNGVQDSGELGISGVTVTLKDAQGATVNTTTTDASGHYSFSNVTAGSYSVVETDPAGYTSTTPNTVAVTVPANGSATAKFGDRQPSGTISGVVFNDANGNGIQDSGELGISGVTVTLKDAQGATVKTTTTDASGQYSFSNVTAGSYSVVETDPAGYTSTTPNTVAVTVPANGSATANFGDRQPGGTISGVVFNDANGNGIQDSGELGISGVTVTLKDAQGATVKTTTTDASGQYSFSNVTAGSYSVVETDPAGYTSTTPNTVAVTVPANGSATAKFGDRQQTGISGIVFNDANGNGVQDSGELGISGVTVTLKDAQGATVKTTTTDASGQYSFSNVTVGSYSVVETDPAGYTSTTPNTVAVNVPANGSATAKFGDRQQTGISGIVFNDANGNGTQNTGELGISGVTITLKDAQGATVNTTTTDSSGQYNFSNVAAGSYSVVQTDLAGYTSTTPNTVAVTVPANGSATAKFGDRQPSGTISGVVFNDANGNGIQDSGELGISGVTVTLKDAQGATVKTTTTDASGQYSFSNVTAGSYSVVETDPANFASTTVNEVSVNVTAAVPAVANFGDRQIGTVSGTVFNDINGNGVQDAGESGISGVRIELLDSNGRPVANITTDSNGQYAFPNVNPGTYTVRETDPSGYVSTTANTVAITVPANGSATAKFGDRQIGTISGIVFNDLNGNGVQDSGELGISGVTVTLKDAQGATVKTTTADASGQYSFSNVTAGSYQVVETDPAGYTSTTPNTVAVTVPANGSATANFGNRQIGAISGVVFNDLDGNGRQDTGESGISGVQVELLDSRGQSVAIMTTASNGGYRFENVEAGNYTVRETDPSGFVSTTPNSVAVSVPTGGAASANFGDQAINSLSGVVFNDLNNNGVRDPGEPTLGGVIVQLKNPAGVVIASATTANDGYYLFSNIVPGQYSVVQIMPAGFVGTTPLALTVTVPANGSATANFGDRQIGSLTGTVFNDSNGNGFQDAGEAGISGVTVTLKDAQGVTVKTTTTDANGQYSFNDVASGSYKVVETDPAGYTSTTANTVAVTVPVNGFATANFGDLKASPNVFDPPSGRKTVNSDGLPVLEWRMVWINNGNVVANRVRVIDAIPAGTGYDPNSLRCEARGESTVATCTYDAVNNQIVYEGDIAADPDALDEAGAKNEVVIVFATRIQPGILNAHNLATAYWDQGGDGNVDDDILSNQTPVKTNDGVPTRLPTDIPFLAPWLFWILAGLLALLGTVAGQNRRLRFGKAQR